MVRKKDSVGFNGKGDDEAKYEEADDEYRAVEKNLC